MTTIDRRLAKLEQGNQPAVHRPPEMSPDEFASLMLAAVARIPDGASADEHAQAIRPWVAAMTWAEVHEFAAALETEAAARGEPKPGQAAQCNRRNA